MVAGFGDGREDEGECERSLTSGKSRPPRTARARQSREIFAPPGHAENADKTAATRTGIEHKVSPGAGIIRQMRKTRRNISRDAGECRLLQKGRPVSL